MKPAVVALVWVICGVFNWGATMQHTAWENTHQFRLLNLTNRDEVGFAFLVSMFGPPGTIATLGFTNFCQHGWSLWPDYAKLTDGAP